MAPLSYDLCLEAVMEYRNGLQFVQFCCHFCVLVEITKIDIGIFIFFIVKNGSDIYIYG